MKHIRNKFFAIVTAAIVLATSCKKVDFGNTNVDPGTTSEPITAALLTNVLSAIGNNEWGSGLSITSGLYCQYFSETQYTDASRYAKPTTDFDGFYTGVLYDLQNIINYNSDGATSEKALKYGSNANQIAVARILKAYYFWLITDYYGDIPYSTALKGSGIEITYDNQENIYADILKELKEAVAQFDGGLPAQGDILLNGDISLWKKFANSLRMLVALRMQKANDALAKAEFTAALSAGGISTNAENISLVYPGGNFLSPLYQYYNVTMRQDYALSKTVTDWLTSRSDNRIAAFGSSSVGFAYGLTRDDAIAFANSNPNWAYVLNNAIRTPTRASNLVTASQVLLARAEAAQRGWTTENAATLYATGIQLNWQQWGVYNATDYANYMANTNIAFSAGTELQKIAIQQWLAFYPNGGQGFANWRRTGYPQLNAAPGQPNAIPRRWPYGPREQQVNTSNWQNAANRYVVNGIPDSQWGRMWWDKP